MLTQSQPASANTHLQHNGHQLATSGEGRGDLRGEGRMTAAFQRLRLSRDQTAASNMDNNRPALGMVRSKPQVRSDTHKHALEKLSVQTNSLARLNSCSGGLSTETQQVILASRVYTTLPNPILAGSVE